MSTVSIGYNIIYIKHYNKYIIVRKLTAQMYMLTKQKKYKILVVRVNILYVI